MRTEIIDDLGTLRAIEVAWWDLWRRQPTATPFSTPAWLIPWWIAFHPGMLLSVAVWKGASLVALAPLYRETGASGDRLLPLGISLSDYADVLVDPEHASAGLSAVATALDELVRPWTSWSMEEVPPDAATLSLSVPAGWTCERHLQSACPVLALPQGRGGLEAVVPALMRRKWRMARRRVARRTHAYEAATAATVPLLLQELFRLHEARWRSKGQGGVLLDPAVRGLHCEAAPRLFEKGLLRLLALRIEGRTAGVYYGFQDARRSYAYLGGFDPAFSFESPGTLLLGEVLEHDVAAGRSDFHFLRGREAYKLTWGAVARWNQRCVFARSGS